MQHVCKPVSCLALCAGIGRHSDPETGPVLHETIRALLNDKLKLATQIPGRTAPALATAAATAAAAAPASEGGEPKLAGCRKQAPAGKLVVSRETLALWLASRNGLLKDNVLS